MSAVVDVTDLQVAYGRDVVVDGLDLVVEPGAVVAVVGPNGVGKSTLLRALCSLQPAVAEAGTVADHRLGSPAARAAATFAGDEPVFFTDVSVAEQLDYLAALSGVDDPGGRVDAVVEGIGLGGRLDDLPGTLSRGWRQRVGLACALVRTTPLLCVDEPFVGLDDLGRDQLVAVLAAESARGAAVLVATHEPDGLAGLDPRTLRLA